MEPQIKAYKYGWDIVLYNYTCRASGMGVGCIDVLSQYRTQVGSSAFICACLPRTRHRQVHPILSVAKKN